MSDGDDGCRYCNGTGYRWSEAWKGWDDCRFCDGTGEANEYE